MAIRIALLVVALLLPRWAEAGCAPIAFRQSPIWRASAGDTTVGITFLGHASFEIVSPAGVHAITDYNGFNVAPRLPDIVTMNHAHSTHYTLSPDPRIRHVLHGWQENGVIPRHDLAVRDLRVSNLPTNIRQWGGSGTEAHGNSIFVFESAGLCIAHLGHLHHLLEPKDIDALGRIDIVMVPIDGQWTMSQADAVAVIEQLQTRVVLPMHYFTRDVLARFLDMVRGRYVIEVRESPSMEISRMTLPDRPTVIALPGGY